MSRGRPVAVRPHPFLWRARLRASAVPASPSRLASQAHPASAAVVVCPSSPVSLPLHLLSSIANFLPCSSPRLPWWQRLPAGWFPRRSWWLCAAWLPRWRWTAAWLQRTPTAVKAYGECVVFWPVAGLSMVHCHIVAASSVFLFIFKEFKKVILFSTMAFPSYTTPHQKGREWKSKAIYKNIGVIIQLVVSFYVSQTTVNLCVGCWSGARSVQIDTN